MLKRFSSFSLDTANECIWRGERCIQLAPKAYAVLAYLVENPGRIVTKDELLETVWPDTFVQESVLKTCILDIRKALGENARNRRHIDTVHRRGYRFVDDAASTPAAAPPSQPPLTNLIGRDRDLSTLRECWERACASERLVVFVTGEPGIGKTSLLEQFLAEVGETATVRLLRGQCIEHFGPSEAYYPVLDAITRGVKDGAIRRLVEVLRKYAPTWMVQLHGIASPEDIQDLKQRTVGATQERMLREMSEALEALAEEEPLLVVVEDLHWSDVSTLDLISMLANRSAPARLLLLTSYRPVDAILSNNPVKVVKQALLARGRCLEVELQHLNRDETAEFLSMRFPNHRLPTQLAGLVYERTSGNPLFLTNVLDYALSRSLIRNQNGEWHWNPGEGGLDLAIPESLSKMIETLVERLRPREQAVLSAASVVGMSFTAHLVAIDDTDDVRSCEECCDDLARRHLFIHSSELGEAPGHTISAEYRFTHPLYRETLYRRLPAAKRMRLHRAIGEGLERLYAGSPTQPAAELAAHFQGARDPGRAILYLRLLGQQCAARSALPDALGALTQAMELAASLPDPGRSTAQLELTEQLGLVHRLMGQLDSSAREFEQMYERARQMRSDEGQLRAQLWLASVASFLDRERCLRAADTVLALSGSGIDPDLRANALGQVAYWNLLFRGWDVRDLAASTEALDAARRSGDRCALSLHANRHSYFLALSSKYYEACKTAEEGIRVGMEIESLVDYFVGHYFEGWALLHLGDWGRMRSLLDSGIRMSERNGNHLWALLCRLLDVFLQVQAFSFETAREQCRSYLERARELRHPLSIQISMVLLGIAELGVGDLGAARQVFEELRLWQARERILMDWIWKLPLQFALTELSLAEGNIDAARAEAETFLTLASATDERTWKALAHYARALVAMTEGDQARTAQELAEAFRIIEGCEAPLAAWRLHTLAARVFQDESHFTRSREVLAKLAGSLAASDPLRECLRIRFAKLQAPKSSRATGG